MSMVVKMPDTGKYKLMIKGADTFIADLAGVQGFDPVGGKAKLDKQLDDFASEGLRTLVPCTTQSLDCQRSFICFSATSFRDVKTSDL